MTMRSHYCGLVTEALNGQSVQLCGWVNRRRDHGGVIFVDLRDREGYVQIVCDPGEVCDQFGHSGSHRRNDRVFVRLILTRCRERLWVEKIQLHKLQAGDADQVNFRTQPFIDQLLESGTVCNLDSLSRSVTNRVPVQVSGGCNL